MSHQDNQLFFVYQYACVAFSRVIAICELLKSGRYDPRDPIYYALVTAAHVIYMKPFAKMRGIPSSVQKQIERCIPDEMKATHARIRRLRNQTFGHVDSEGFTAFNFPLNLNHVKFIVSNGQVRPAVSEFRVIAASAIDELLNLARRLDEKATYHSNKLLNNRLVKVPARDGVYDLNVSDPNAPALVPAKANKP